LELFRQLVFFVLDLRKAVPAPHVAPSCYTCYLLGDRSWMRKGPNYDYNKQNISVVLWWTSCMSPWSFIFFISMMFIVIIWNVSKSVAKQYH
jgi:hypothetical protein